MKLLIQPNAVLFQLHNMDPNDLLSFLDGPGELATPPSSGAGSEGGRAGGAASQEDLLSLFDWSKTTF